MKTQHHNLNSRCWRSLIFWTPGWRFPGTAGLSILWQVGNEAHHKSITRPWGNVDYDMLRWVLTLISTPSKKLQQLCLPMPAQEPIKCQVPQPLSFLIRSALQQNDPPKLCYRYLRKRQDPTPSSLLGGFCPQEECKSTSTLPFSSPFAVTLFLLHL